MASRQLHFKDEVDIKNYPIFESLTSEEADLFDQDVYGEVYKRGSYLYHEGNRVKGCYFVRKGIVKVFKTGVDGKEQIIRFAKEGDLVGFRSVINGESACTTAKIIDEATLFFIPSNYLVEIFRENANFAMALMHVTCKELGESNKYMTDIAQKTVRERLAEVLLMLMDSFDLDEDHYLQISLTREELANMVGTATESVIRLLSEFKHDKLIELNGRRIRILDIPGLIKTGNIYD